MLVGLALFAGCISPSTGSSGMPLWVAISAEIEGGEQATILVEFVAPEEPPSLRYGETSLQLESPYPNPKEGIHLAVAGVGRGFSIDETEAGVSLNLPHRSRSIPIFGPETTLVDVVWLDELPLSVQQEVDENFRLIERIRILPNPSRVDGDLSDWSGNRALPIDSISNILSGADQWSGSRDASFGVAAHLHRGRLEVGVRVRDDDVLLERDHLEIETEYGTWSFPLKDSGVYSLADGAEVAFTEQSGFGVGLEFGVPMAGNIPQIDQLPLIVRYLDVDTDDQTGSPVVISSAPSIDILLRSTPL